MAYDTTLANKVREFLAEIPNIEIEEKEMFAILKTYLVITSATT